MEQLILESGEACPYSTSCVHNKNWQCQGSLKGRITEFTCSIVSTRESGGGDYRNPLDQTGKMEVIMD